MLQKLNGIDNIPLVINGELRRILLEFFDHSESKKYVFNKYHSNAPLGSLSIMRPSHFSNPYPMCNAHEKSLLDIYNATEDREIVVVKHLLTILHSSDEIKRIQTTLRGKDLVCCCSPKICHGDILTFIANYPTEFKDRLKQLILFISEQNHQDKEVTSWKHYTRLVLTLSNI